MDAAKIAELELSVTAAEQAAADAGGSDGALNQAIVTAKEALAKAKVPSQESKRTEKEKAAFSLQKNAERARELGIDPAEVLGIKPEVENDEVPEWFKRHEADKAQKTALQLADAIADEQIRATVKDYLSNNIRPSGDAEKDFKLALAAASAGKNKLIVEEINRIVPPKRTASGGSAPPRLEEEFTPTPEEQPFMRPPYNVSKEKILAARAKQK